MLLSFLKMSKKLKLGNLTSTRSLRSKNKAGKIDVSSTISKYFNKEEEEEVPDEIERKSKPTKKVDLGNEYETDCKVKIEELKDEVVVPNKIEKKKRKHIKVEYEEPQDTSQLNCELKIEDQVKEETAVNKDEWVPKNWETILENIKEMRKHGTAPVDTMGCHKCADPKASAKQSRFQSLVALMLSSQTKDQVTYTAMQRLKTYGCSPEILANSPDETLGKLIYPVGFWKRKAEYIKKTSQILIAKYDSDIPNTIKELCDLPGVGPKMAHICMQVAWGEVSGIGVDTHVHRIVNRLKWTEKPTKTPEETRIGLEKWLPKDLWSTINHLLVGFGQEICLPQHSKCSECLNKDICPSSRIKKT